MAVNLRAPDPKSLFAVSGIELGWAEAGIRKVGRKDLLVVRIAEGAHVDDLVLRKSTTTGCPVTSASLTAADTDQLTSYPAAMTAPVNLTPAQR